MYIGFSKAPGGSGVTSLSGWSVDNTIPGAPVMRGLVANTINQTANLNGGAFIGIPVFDTSLGGEPNFNFLKIRGNPGTSGADMFYDNLLGRLFLQAISATGVSRILLRNNGQGQWLYSTNGGVSFQSGANVGFLVQADGAQVAKIGFFKGTGVYQQGPIPGPAGGATVDTEARNAINAILAAFINYGLLKP
jgi:hypothetical protein